jgi:hypothetical protein
MEKVLFKEEQSFHQWWLWLIIILSTLISTVPFMIGIYTQEVLEKSWGNHPGSTGLLVFVLVLDLVIMLGIIWLFLKMSLQVEIREGGLHYKFPPLLVKWKAIVKEEIESFTVRTYRPVSEFGGWGIKGSRRKKAYNVSGNIGLELVLKNGRKVLFGTQKSQAIKYAMEKMMNGERLKNND